jgi:tRNA threonylcarbamoyladenosine biosynthesis protein TsaB
MKLLALDTSTLVMGVAVFDMETKRVLGEVITNLHKNHSVRLMPTIAQLLTELELSLEDIHALAVTSGPGSYTGIRIGVTTAKTMAWARDLPLYSESSLTVLAMNGLRFDGLVVPLFNARRRRVYSGVYAAKDGEMVEVIPAQVVPIENWLEQIEQLGKPVLFLGDDVEKFRQTIVEQLGEMAQFGMAAENLPRPGHLAWVAYRKWSRHEPPEHADFAPNYLQLTEAEANWLKKHGKEEGENG